MVKDETVAVCVYTFLPKFVPQYGDLSVK
jgi:hypothetical protein